MPVRSQPYQTPAGDILVPNGLFSAAEIALQTVKKEQEIELFENTHKLMASLAKNLFINVGRKARKRKTIVDRVETKIEPVDED